MKRIVQLLLILICVVWFGNAYAAGEYDQKTEFRSNFWYGSNDTLSPDLKRLLTFAHQIGNQIKSAIKYVIGADAYYALANGFDNLFRAIDHMFAGLKNFFNQPWGKRMEWKAT
ncbi:hypothetical protein [Candidatus Magnetaquicoccus inordinatus]|uniref:hypothetical protein n=1 Tax=Candidatus Magnetaquicoccus inordinatus TaxID=2496818 RepID=UPI00102BC856|nr:hypothetical protein [Candidatus Magnetaquicoccus inordinatus]